MPPVFNKIIINYVDSIGFCIRSWCREVFINPIIKEGVSMNGTKISLIIIVSIVALFLILYGINSSENDNGCTTTKTMESEHVKIHVGNIYINYDDSGNITSCNATDNIHIQSFNETGLWVVTDYNNYPSFIRPNGLQVINLSISY